MDVGARARAIRVVVEAGAMGALIEVAAILLCGKAVRLSDTIQEDSMWYGKTREQHPDLHGAHRRDIETEQPTTNNRNSGDTVDIPDLIHLARSFQLLSQRESNVHKVA